MISPSDRSKAVELIDVAAENGASLAAACKEAGINPRTYNRWNTLKTESGDYIDRRTTCKRPVPKNKLTELEERRILNIVHDPKYSSLPPSSFEE